MRCWPARLPHSVGTLVPVTPPVTYKPEMEIKVHKVFTITDNTRALSWLKEASTTTITFNPQSVDMKFFLSPM